MPDHPRFDDLGDGDHVCLVYESSAEQAAAVVPYLAAGLARAESCVYVAVERATAEVRALLGTARVDVEEACRSGRVIVLTKDEFRRPGPFDPRGMLAHVRALVDRLVATGAPGVRVAVEMTWAPATGVPSEALLEYEAIANDDFFPGAPVSALCQYRRSRFPAAVLERALRAHPLVAIGGRLVHNVYYEPPRLAVGSRSAEERLDRILEHLGQVGDAAQGRWALAAAQAERAEAEAERQHAALVAEASRILAASLDYRATLASVARLVVPSLADWCVVQVEEGDRLRRVATAFADPDHAEIAAALDARYGWLPMDRVRGSGGRLGKALDTGEAQLVRAVSDAWLERVAVDAEHLALVRRLGVRSLILAPLTTRGRTVGAMLFARTRPDALYGAADLALAEEIGRRAAVAVDNARLFAESERRRRQAEALAEVGTALTQRLDPDVVARRIANSVWSLLGGSSAVVYRLLPESDDLVALAVAGDIGPAFEPTFVLPRGAATVGLAVSERRPVVTTDVLADPRIALPPDVRARVEQAPHRAVLALPLIVEDRPIGALMVGDRRGRVFDDEAIRLAQAFAGQAAAALENARLYRQAHEANRLKDEFLATLSHELRTPLTAILGWVRLLQTQQLDAETTTRAFEVIERNAKAQAQLIGDLLDVSRIITGKLRIEGGPAELPAIVEAALDAMRPAAEARSIYLAVSLDPAARLVWGDAARLQQVVWNLLSNAIKFTPPGGRVTVTSAFVDGDVRITVSDTGRGISPRFLPYVFERFHQGESTSTRAHGGLGLGLAIVRHLVELHGGTVEAESAGEGQGATFSVRLPALALVRQPGVPVGTRQRDDDDTASPLPLLGGVHVLVVDDEADTRDMLQTALEQCGATVTTAASAAEAFEAVAQRPPDVLIADIAMPGENGYSLIERVRELPSARGGSVPAVALTAYASAADRTRALAAGYHMHLTKPVEPGMLAAVIADLASVARAARRAS